MKAIRTALALFLTLPAAIPAWSNLRLARKTDGIVSGGLRLGPPAGGARLLAERLEASLAGLDPSRLDPKDTVLFTVVYEIENPGGATLPLSVRFVAVDIRGLAAELNGRALAPRIVQAPEERPECLIRIARHRSAFLPFFYEDFLKRLRNGAGLDRAPDGSWLDKLGPEDLGEPAFASLFRRTLEPSPEKDFPSAEFEIPLPPGRSRLTVSYRQRLFIDERGNGYFAAWPKKGVTGFDYLLYPARTWDLDPGFRLRLAVTIPDARTAPLLVFRGWDRPRVKSSLALRPSTEPKNHVQIYEGDFAGLPAEVWTFLFWLDRSAEAYLR